MDLCDSKEDLFLRKQDIDILNGYAVASVDNVGPGVGFETGDERYNMSDSDVNDTPASPKQQ